MKLSSLNFIESVLPSGFRLFIRKQAKRLFGLLLFSLAIYLITSLISWTPYDPSLNNYNSNSISNILGISGAIISDLMLQFIGLGSFIFILIILMISLDMIIQSKRIMGVPRYIKYPIYFLSWLVLLSNIGITENNFFKSTINWSYLVGAGGLLGDSLSQLIRGIITENFRTISNNNSQQITFFISSLIIVMTFFINRLLLRINRTRNYKLLESDQMHQQLSPNRLSPLVLLLRYILKSFAYILSRLKSLSAFRKSEETSFEEIRDSLKDRDGGESIIIGESIESDISLNTFDKPKKVSRRKKTVNDTKENLDLFEQNEFSLPSVNLLKINPEKNYEKTINENELEMISQELSNVLLSYKVNGEITDIKPGPVVTLFELEPSLGTKSTRVVGLAEDIAMSMAAESARVAIIPGQNKIGIELPIAKRSTVFLSDLIQSEEFEKSSYKLAIALGKNIGGKTVVVDLASMPHLLIAGTTGSGKSVGINTMILSLLYKYSPEDCKLIMIDPKMLELSLYEGIPHLLTPVVTEPKKAVVALKWIVREMEKRYKNMSKIGVRDLEGYNKKIDREGGTIKTKVRIGFDEQTGKPNYHNEEITLKKMPFIVVIVDEMADLMAVAGKEIEHSVARLGAMARSAGIHLIMATQRPSTDVISGVIKANFPARVSFKVSSKIDSRVVLGEAGAEQLLGKGDMLYVADGNRTTRIHGAFVDDKEVADIVNYLKKQATPNFIDEILEEPEEANKDPGEYNNIDPQLFQRAIEVIISGKKASTSYVQRRLGIGYNKAANIIEKMENDGIISEADTYGRREILLTEQNFDNI
tara:strand:+ start:2184 stop:4631 length:2448 start_codon:yes stop_codon:yes gene_type:complete